MADNGRGWHFEEDERLLDPFVTTKTDGMGLGLSICRSILAAHSGDIRLTHAPRGGAQVELSLPYLATAELERA